MGKIIELKVNMDEINVDMLSDSNRVINSLKCVCLDNKEKYEKVYLKLNKAWVGIYDAREMLKELQDDHTSFAVNS